LKEEIQVKNSKYKVEFTLKQHTPIIHFQSDQSGATLRATELKPKFDRFLIERVQGLPYKKNANGELSLDYKVKIVAIDNKVETIEKINPNNDRPIPDPLFFGNMGDGEKKKFTQADELVVEFLSFVPEVKTAIEKHFEAFVTLTNFGTRQSKGYGSFYLAKPFDAILIPYKVYSFNTSNTNWKNDIKLFYSFLRQGINYPRGNATRFYSKPAIFTYALKNNWTWDKKAIKQHFFPNELQDQKGKYDANSPVNFNGEKTYLLRDLFGLSSEQNWMSYRSTIKKENSTINRFKSPITFKIVGNKIYFWADESVEMILNKSFKVSTRGNKPLDLSTPKEFSFDAFFEYVKTIDLSQHIDNKYHNEVEFRTLLRILNDIKASK